MGHQCCGNDHNSEEEIVKDNCCGGDDTACCGEHGDTCCSDDDCSDDHGCGCGCGDDHDHSYVQLTDAEGNEREYRIIGTFDVEEEEYIALLDEEESQVYLFAFVEEGESLQLKQIEDQEKFERVSKAFNAMME